MDLSCLEATLAKSEEKESQFLLHACIQVLLMLSASTVEQKASRSFTWGTIYLETSSKQRRSKHGGKYYIHLITNSSTPPTMCICRTFLVIPELKDEVSIWEANQCKEVCTYQSMTRPSRFPFFRSLYKTQELGVYPG